MREFRYQITDKDGVHARPAGELAKAAKSFDCRITLERNGKTAQADRMLAVMSLGIQGGDTICVTLEGPQEEEAERRMREFFKTNL